MAREAWIENWVDRRWQEPAYMEEFLSAKAREMWPDPREGARPLDAEALHCELGDGIAWALRELFWDEFSDYMTKRAALEYDTTPQERER